MRRQTLMAVTVVIALAACSRRTAEARASSASTSASGAVEITDDQIERFIAWSREWGDLARNHYEEGAAVSKRVADKYMPDLSRMSDDPELRATLDRQRAEMQEHMNR